MNEPSSDRAAWWEGDYVFRPREAPPSELPPVLQPADEAPLPTVPCWRCGKGVSPIARLCPFCRAQLRPDTPEEAALGQRITLPSTATPPLLIAVGLSLVLTVVNLIGGAICRFAVAPTEKDLQTVILVVEIVDSVLVLIAVCMVRGLARTPSVPTERKAIAWLVGVLLLGLLLGVNYAYHALLKQLLPAVVTELNVPVTLLNVIIVCVQPAIFEELCFRYLAMGALRNHVGLHGAVMISSIMFGMAHIGAPLSIPILTVVGMGLAYMRHFSGGLLLPMAMHFGHNLAILVLSEL